MLVLLVAATLAEAAGAAGAPRPTRTPAVWEQSLHLPGAFDLAGPRGDGRLVAAAHDRLVLVGPSGQTRSFAPAYSVPDGSESYMALSPGLTVDGAGCRFDRDEVLALDLRPNTPAGITKVTAAGKVSRLAAVPGVSTLTGITLDTVGGFGHRLLVIGPSQSRKTEVTAVDCRGRATSIGTVDVPLEGGITVAPRSFGSYGGQLIAADELGGSIYAISPGGRLSTVTRSDLPAGQDVGVESAGFVPARAAAAYLADRGTPGNPHQGTDSVLRLTGTALTAAGVRAGDLLVATEGGANVVRVRCAGQCTSAVVATGPASAHGEGRLLITARPTSSSGGRAGAIAIGIAVVIAVAAAIWLLGRRSRRTTRTGRPPGR